MVDVINSDKLIVCMQRAIVWGGGGARVRDLLLRKSQTSYTSVSAYSRGGTRYALYIMLLYVHHVY